MTLTTWFIIGYLSGYVFSYFLIWWITVNRQKNDWTLYDRLVAMLIALLSWLFIILFCVTLVVGRFVKVNLDKKVKW